MEDEERCSEGGKRIAPRGREGPVKGLGAACDGGNGKSDWTGARGEGSSTQGGQNYGRSRKPLLNRPAERRSYELLSIKTTPGG